MYTNRKGFGLVDLIVKIIFVAIFVLLLIWLFRTYTPNMIPFYSNVFRENVSYMKDAAKSYFTNDELPTELGQSVRLSLKQMEDMNLVIPFVDKDGKACDKDKSYAEVTREEKGYTLRVNLTCGKETKTLVEILGCYDYCKDCKNPVALEYEFTREVNKKVTTLSCPSGYTRNGKICSKKIGTETISATKNYTKEKIEVTDALYTKGASQTVAVSAIKTVVNIASKQYGEVIKDTETNKNYVPANKNVTSNKSYTQALSDTNKVYTNSEKETSESCKTVSVKDPNCSVQCVTSYVNGVPKKVCNTCGYISQKSCSDVTTYHCPNNYTSEGSGSSLKCYRNETTYSCPDGYTEEGSGSSLKCYKNESTTTYSCPKGYSSEGSGSNLKCYKNETTTTYSCAKGLIAEGSGSNLKCYKNVDKSVTTYSCPKDSTSNNGKTGEDLRCYKVITGEKTPYCSNANAKLDTKTGKCTLVIPSQFSSYSCKSGYTLDKVNGTCSKSKITTVKATSTTTEKKVTETKWSTSKELEGWTATGKTRQVSSK